MIAIGDLVGEKYRVERIVGRGGMGMVVAATHLQLGSTVALKFLHERMAAHPHVAERFLREARATAVLKSEHVCRVFDVGTHTGMPYLVMELLEGTDLSRMLKQRGPLPIDEACHYVLQACAGLAEAHAARIIHRDLKPANLFVTTRSDGSPLVKVVDFGIAKAGTDQNTELTQSDSILGSPSYMSLEQLRSSKLVDTRSDIWSLGVTLFELVSGTRPYYGDGPADLALKIALLPAPQLPAEIAELQPLVARCLQKEPADRFQTVAELAAALAPFAASRGSVPSIVRARSEVSPLSAAMTVQVEPTVVPTTLNSGIGVVETPLLVKPPRSRWPVIAAAAAIVVGVGLGIVVSRPSAPSTAHRPAITPAAEPATTPAPPPAAAAATATATPAAAEASPTATEATIDAGAVIPTVPTAPTASETTASDDTVEESSESPIEATVSKPKPKPTKLKPKATKPKPAATESDFRHSRI